MTPLKGKVAFVRHAIQSDIETEFATYRCSVELSVRYDGQIQSESEHASLIDGHARFILWQTGPTLDLL